MNEFSEMMEVLPIYEDIFSHDLTGNQRMKLRCSARRDFCRDVAKKNKNHLIRTI